MKVLICGAGIAGTAMAYWLRRHGFQTAVVERAPAIRDGGYKVDIRGVAADVVERMGIGEQVRSHATGMRTATQVDTSGKAIAVLDAELFGGRHAGDAEIMRGDLNRLLYNLTRDDVEYIFGDSVAAIDAGEGAVRFESGRSATFDVIVGADGVHSATRSLVFNREVRHDLGHYIAIYTVPNYLGLDRQEVVHLAPGKTVNVYSTGSSDAKALFLFASSRLDFDHRDIATQQRLLTDAMRGMGWEVPRLLAEMPAARDFYFDSLTQVRMDSWSQGQVALVGDAAYCASPASGQGTSLALVGAYVLSGEMKTDVGTAFNSYEAKMRDFVAANQALATGNLRGMVVGSKAGVWMQTRMMKLLPYLPGKDKIIGRIADTIHEAATSITLEDYR